MKSVNLGPFSFDIKKKMDIILCDIGGRVAMRVGGSSLCHIKIGLLTILVNPNTTHLVIMLKNLNFRVVKDLHASCPFTTLAFPWMTTATTPFLL